MPFKGEASGTGDPQRGNFKNAQLGITTLDAATDPSTTESVAEEGDSWVGPALAGAGALAAGVLLRNPTAASAAWKGLKGAGNSLLDLRQLSMLTGLAPLKSTLGNIGGAVNASIERGTAKPLKELFSGKTLSDIATNYKKGAQYGGTSSGPLANLINKTGLPTPGRVMGALDESAQAALRRAGLSAKDAEREMLQTPISKDWAGALENPAARYLVPFRRTPFNQFKEGMASFDPKTKGEQAALAYNMVTGAASGASFDDPKTIGLTTAASGRYALPHAASAAASRYLTTGSKSKGAEALRGMTPISEYSTEQGVLGPIADPTTLVPKPAAVGAYEYLRSLLGME